MSGPAIPDAKDPRFLEAVREALQVLLGQRGNPLDQAATPRMLGWTSAMNTAGQKVISSGGTGGGTSGGTGGTGGTGASDTTPPPTPAGFTAQAGVANVFVQIDAPAYAWGGGNRQTNIYGVARDVDDTSPAPAFGDAQRIHSMPGPQTFTAIPSEPKRKWYLWARFESYAGVESITPAGGTHGVQAETGNAENLIRSLQAENAWIDNAMVANLAAAKLTIGSGEVGGPLKSTNYIPGTSGWLLDPVTGRIYAMDCVLSGTVHANYGSVGGINIFSNSFESSNFNGAGDGFSISSDGTIYAGAINLKTALSARVFNTLAVGQDYVFKIDDAFYIKANGEMEISALNVIDTLSIKGDAITETSIARTNFSQIIASDSYEEITSLPNKHFLGKYLVTITGQAESISKDAMCNVALYVNDVQVCDVELGIVTSGGDSNWKMPICINYGGESTGDIRFKIYAKSLTNFGGWTQTKISNIAICFYGYKR